MLCSTHGRQSPGKTRGRNSGDLNPSTQPGEPGTTGHWGQHQIQFSPLQELGNYSFSRILVSWSEPSSFFSKKGSWLVSWWVLTCFQIRFCSLEWHLWSWGQGLAAAPGKMTSRDGANNGRAPSGDVELDWLSYQSSELHFSPLRRLKAKSWMEQSWTEEDSLVQWSLHACVYWTSIAHQTQSHTIF